MDESESVDVSDPEEMSTTVLSAPAKSHETELRYRRGQEADAGILEATADDMNKHEVGDATQSEELPKAAHKISTELRQRIMQDGLEEELCCSVCLCLASQPTTLVCGHTSCRVCLARWYFSSNKKECPLCRNAYQGHPKVNTQLRSLINKLYPDKIEEREKEMLENIEDLEIVQKYDDALAKERENAPGRREMDSASFCSGLFIAFGCFLVGYLALHIWQEPDSNTLVLEPVQSWKSRHVATWLREMSWASDYADLVEVNNIDGRLLLSLDEEGIETMLNVTDSHHKRALMFAIQALRDDGLKMPVNLWEYKALYPGRCLFLVFGLKDFPRTSLLYMYLYFYDDMFLPLLQATTSSRDSLLEHNSSVDTSWDSEPFLSSDESISTSQWVSFIVYAVLIPNKLFIVFALQMFGQHRFTSSFVFATAVSCQCLEYLTWYSLIKKPSFSSVWIALKSHYKLITSAFMFTLVWPIIPSIICDVFFYGALYFSPFQVSKGLYETWRGLHQDVV